MFSGVKGREGTLTGFFTALIVPARNFIFDDSELYEVIGTLSVLPAKQNESRDVNARKKNEGKSRKIFH